jgi:branched-chain amino acid transport system substrate-binding protein
MHARTVVGLLLAAATALVPLAGASQSATPYKIGMTFPLTGPLASVSTEYIPGAQLAAEDINRHGGVKGHPIQIVVEDTQSTPQGGVAAMRKLVEVDGVQAIVTIYTNVVTAQMPLADQLKVPTLSNILTPGLVSRSQFSFVHQATMESVSPVLERFWRAHHVKRVYGIFSDNAFGQQFAPLARATAERAGAAFAVGFLDLTVSDYRGVAVRAKEFNPDAFFIAAQGGQAETTAIRQLRELGLTVPMYNAAVFYQERSWREAVGAYSEGMYFAGVAVPDGIAHAFIAGYRAKTGFNPDYNAAQEYDIVKLFADAIAKSSYNGQAIRNVLATSTGVPSVFGGTISMGPDHYTVTSSVGLWQVRKGRLVAVDGGSARR